MRRAVFHVLFLTSTYARNFFSLGVPFWLEDGSIFLVGVDADGHPHVVVARHGEGVFEVGRLRRGRHVCIGDLGRDDLWGQQ